MDKPERSSYTPLDFLGWRAAGSLEIVPKFQRRGVWTTAARSYLIDTLLRRMPVPPIYIRVSQSEDRTRIVREIIDGQQRTSAVLDYVDGKYPLSRSLAGPYAGKRFSQLSVEEQDAIREYSFSCEVFDGSVSDADILEIFARMNTYSVNLNKQELRNGKYFGYFKQSAYGLAREHIEFWRRHRIFAERSIARMAEVELTSELLIQQIDGVQDQKKSIDGFYTKFEDEFEDRGPLESKFRSTFDSIDNALGDSLEAGEFNRPPLFYSLFGAVYHRTFGLVNVKLDSPFKPLDENDRQRIYSAAVTLSERVQQARESQSVPVRYLQFVNACLTTTDNLPQRNTRLEVLYREAFE